MSVVHKLPTICYSYLSGFLHFLYQLFVSGLANITGVTCVINSICSSKNLNIPIVFQFLLNIKSYLTISSSFSFYFLTFSSFHCLGCLRNASSGDGTVLLLAIYL
jgi:hypothetical protein